MRKLRILTLLLLLPLAPGVVTVVACRASREHAPAAQAAAKRWHCPMHPQIVKDGPGECPICGMDLVPIEPTPDAAQKAPAQHAESRRVLFYRSPMNPAETSPVPRKDEMGMDFVPVYSDEAGQASDAAGLATVKIDTAKQQLMGLKTTTAAPRSIAATIRTVGRVTFDETRVHHLHTRYDAYVEHVHPDANFVGAFVKAGEPLLTLYSPDLYSTEQEYLLALRAQRRLGQSDAPGVARQGEDLLEAARQRLLLWDVPASEIAQLEETGQANRTFQLSAPTSGFVIAKVATHGMKVTPADSLFDIADLSRVWVFAEVYESELPRVAVGQKATMTLSYWPGKSWTGRVTYVFPTVDEKTRTVKVRTEFDNPGAQLKPEMYADMVLSGSARTALAVPEDAVLSSGTRSIVFVSLGEGKLQPREVKTGQRSEGFLEILSGLKEGETIAEGASFLVDSESRLKAALSAYEGTKP
jgi:RND family efflux transporter MFP subunit